VPQRRAVRPSSSSSVAIQVRFEMQGERSARSMMRERAAVLIEADGAEIAVVSAHSGSGAARHRLRSRPPAGASNRAHSRGRTTRPAQARAKLRREAAQRVQGPSPGRPLEN
jgi:hypothetical protein